MEEIETSQESAMGKLFCVMGKSSSGKDTIYQRIRRNQKLQLQEIIPFTTRPIREGEADGREYHFVSDETALELEKAGKILEIRAYDTIYGIWKYFTVADEHIDLQNQNYIMIGTLEAYCKIRDYYGEESVVPIYIEVEDGERLMRALNREKKEAVPKYNEMCRRFLADGNDFSEENLKAAKITKRFENMELEATIREITAFILEVV